MTRALAGALVLLLALGAAPSHAQTQEPPSTPAVQQARARFVEGAAFAARAQWREALDRFEESASLRPHAVVTFNIAYCERELGRAMRALVRFRRALDEDARSGGVELTEELRGGAKEYANELEEQLARAIVTVDPPGASISVDGAPLEAMPGARPRPTFAAGLRGPGEPEPAPAATFEVLLEPGRHVFLVASGDRSRTVEEELAPSAPLRLTISVQPAPPRDTRAPIPKAPPHGQPARTTMPTQRVGAIVLGGVSITALAAGAVLGGLAAASWGDALDACPARTTCPDDRGRELSEDTIRYGNLATVGWVTAGAAAAGAIVLWLTAPDGSPTPARQRAAAPRAATVLRW